MCSVSVYGADGDRQPPGRLSNTPPNAFSYHGETDPHSADAEVIIISRRLLESLADRGAWIRNLRQRLPEDMPVVVVGADHEEPAYLPEKWRYVQSGELTDRWLEPFCPAQPSIQNVVTLTDSLLNQCCRKLTSDADHTSGEPKLKRLDQHVAELRKIVGSLDVQLHIPAREMTGEEEQALKSIVEAIGEMRAASQRDRADVDLDALADQFDPATMRTVESHPAAVVGLSALAVTANPSVVIAQDEDGERGTTRFVVNSLQVAGPILSECGFSSLEEFRGILAQFELPVLFH